MSSQSIESINQLSETEFVELLGGVYEHSPWVASAVYSQRPFSDRAGLALAMRSMVEAASAEQRLGILKAHPEFAGKAARDGTLTASSTAEQGRLSLAELPAAQNARMREFNQHFMQKFGFPGIVCVRLHSTVEGIFESLEWRANNEIDVEIGEAMGQVYQIVNFRLADLIAD